MSILKVENIKKSFGNIEVLKDISFSLEKGEVLAIIGSSGSGKTTLLRCLNFLETPDVGTISLDGKMIFDAENHKKLSDAEIRENRLHFGLVFQSFNLFPQYTVFKNITLAPILLIKHDADELKKQLKQKQVEHVKKLKEEGVTDKKQIDAMLKEQFLTSKDIKAQIESFKSSKKQEILEYGEELLAKIGLVEKRNSYPCELSGGQQQRVAIARALAIKPKVLCFDEPTSALDPELTGEVLKVIRSLKDDGRTMIIVTHEMGFAKHVSDKILFMADGVVEEEGDPVQLIENPKSEKLKAFLANVSEKEEI